MNQDIQSVKRLEGIMTVPGDKSVSHRALMFGAIATGDTHIRQLSHGQDVQSTRRCLEQCGVSFTETADSLIVHGAGFTLQAPENILDAGNSGTTMRLFSGILAAQPFQCTIKGDASLTKRPMKRIIEPLTLMGASIESENGYPPLRISGKQLIAIDYLSPVASAQVKSCILIAGLFSNGITSVTEPQLSRDHTERMLPCFGIPVQRDGLKVSVEGPARLQGTSLLVPGDISSAAFFMVAASLLPDSKLVIQNVGMNPSRTGIYDVLIQMGGKIAKQNQRIENGEPVADLVIESSHLRGVTIEGNMIPKLIDELPLLAVAATQAEGRTIIRDAKELRVKESDRIETVANNLKAMGCEITATEDGFIIDGPQPLQGATLPTYHDHRIAMSFAIAGLFAKGRTTILDAETAEISFPGFYNLLDDITYG